MDIVIFFANMIIGMLSLIPEPVWAASVGGGIAYFSVAASNRNHRMVRRDELKHDALENEKERKVAFRKGVYLKFADEMVRFCGYLGSLSQVNLSKFDANSEVRNFQAVANQAALISESETSYLILGMNAQFSILIIDVVEKLMPINLLMNAIETQTEFYNQAQLEIQRILADRLRMAETNDPDVERFNQLGLSFDFQTSRAEKASKERTKLSEELSGLSIEYGHFLLKRLDTIGDEMVKIMVAIRFELGVESDLDTFSRLWTEQRKLIAIRAEEAFGVMNLKR